MHNVFVSSIEKHIDGVYPHEEVELSYSKIEERFTASDSSMRSNTAQSVGDNAEIGEVM